MKKKGFCAYLWCNTEAKMAWWNDVNIAPTRKAEQRNKSRNTQEKTVRGSGQCGKREKELERIARIEGFDAFMRGVKRGD